MPAKGLPVEAPQRRRVLMLGPALWQRGGIAAVERAYLDAWDHRRYQVRHIATYASHYDVKVVKLQRAIWAFLRAAWAMAIWRPHIVHVHVSERGSLYRKSAFVVLARAFHAGRIVLHMHASGFQAFYEGSGTLRRRWIRFVLRSADRLVVLGESPRRFFTGLAPSVPTDVLPNPVVCPPAAGDHANRPCIVLTLGELGRRKGTYDTLRAIPDILRLHPDAEFWFGGDGDTEAVRAIIDHADWGRKVRLLGWVEGPAKEALLAEARVFLLPSHNEGLPVAILEAMAHGLPVVATAVGGIPDAVTDGDTGFLIEPGDIDAIVARISLLLEDPGLAERMGRRARQHAQATFDVRAIMLHLFAVYDLVLDSTNATTDRTHDHAEDRPGKAVTAC